MIVLNIIALYVLGISIILFGLSIFTLRDKKSKILSAVFTFGYTLTMLAYMIK